MTSRFVRWSALGIGLFVAALSYVDVDRAAATIRRLGAALPLALVFSGLWHLARTWAWAWCFADRREVGFLRLMRVRLSAEAFSYLTLRGIAGEPLKVVLLADRVDPRAAAASVALERIAYLVGTTIIVGIGSVAAIAGLPLTEVWFRIFRAFAIAAFVVTGLTVLVVTGRGTYLTRMLRRVDAVLGTAAARGRVGRFVVAVEAQMLDLVRGNPARLIVLLVATTLSYVFMALEAWVILRGSGLEPAATLNAAFAVETFSRVASFASAFIPANLGALEASSLAAVAAVGAAGGGAALAIVRRIRGLFWAGVGLAIYPRSSRPVSVPRTDVEQPHESGPRATLLYLPDDSATQVPAAARLAGVPIAERVLRAAARAGYTRLIVWTGAVNRRTGRVLQRLARSLPGVALVSSDDEWAAALQGTDGASEWATTLGPATVVSPALLETAAAMCPAAGGFSDVPASAACPESGALRVSIADALDRRRLEAQLAARRLNPGPRPSGEEVSNGLARLALHIETPADLARAEATIRRASYKDTDNTLARFNRRISLPISIGLIRTPLTANQLSILLVALGFYSAWLFSLGHYWTGVLAALLSLAASILDGCDGEIARLKYQESALGCWIETAGDYSYYIAIFVGLTVGAVRQTQVEAFYWIGGLALAGTLTSFVLLIYLRSRITDGRPERLHAIARDRFTAEPTFWSRLLWRLAFTATRSAMPYGIAALAIVHALPAVVVLAAIGAHVYWMSLAVRLRTLVGEVHEGFG